jgi:hypothetical protein
MNFTYCPDRKVVGFLFFIIIEMKSKHLVFFLVAGLVFACVILVAATTLIAYRLNEDENGPVNSSGNTDGIYSVSEIIYTDTNGSVSPEYKLTTEITITPKKIVWGETQGYPSVGDTYKVLSNETVEIDKDDFNDILEYIDSLDIKERKASNDCVGGGTTSLTMTGDDYDLDGYYSICGTKLDGNLTNDPSDLEEFIQENYMD